MICASYLKYCVFFLMIRRPPRSTRTDTLFPYTTRFRSEEGAMLVPVCNKIEAEIAELDDGEEKDMFLEALGLEEPGLNRVIRAGYEMLHLQTYFRSEEHTSELQSLMRISYAVFCLKKKKHPHFSICNIKNHTLHCH